MLLQRTWKCVKNWWKKSSKWEELYTNKRFGFSRIPHLYHVPWSASRTKGWTLEGAKLREVLERSFITSGWSWNQFVRTEPKSRGNSMSRHPWSQFVFGFNITGFCQVQWKFIISSLKTGVLLIPNWLVWFSSFRPSYCSEAKEEMISLCEFAWR